MMASNMISKIVHLKLVLRWCCRIPSLSSLPVYVGDEHRRFVIPIRFLNLPVFASLLNKAEEEFGFKTTGGLVLPCNVVFFKKVLKVLKRDELGSSALDLDDFMKMFSDLTVDSSSSCKNCRLS